MVNVYDTKTNLSSLLQRVEKYKETIIITKHGHPVAELGPLTKKTRLLTDPVLRDIRIMYDPTEPTESEWGLG